MNIFNNRNLLELAERNASKIVEVCAGIKHNERVLIITDKNRPITVSQILARNAAKIAQQVSIIVAFDEITQLNNFITSSIKKADVILAPTTKTIGHSTAIMNALSKGSRVLALTEFSENSLLSESFDTDFLKLRTLIEKVEKEFNRAGRVHVFTSEGTDIFLDITGRIARSCSGICHNPGEMMAIPDVEVYIAPIENKTNGRLVVDASCSSIGIVKEKIVLEIKNGIVINIEGGNEAKKLKNILYKTNSESSYIVGEFAIGLNPKGTVIGTISVDEGISGTGHFALGKNITFGGKNDAPIHLDMVYWKPNVELDNRPFMENGKLVMLKKSERS